MDPFTTGFLTSIAASLTNHVLSALGRRLRDTVAGTEEKKALERCIEVGVVALVTTAGTDVPEEKALLADIFGRFAADEDVGKELGALFRGNAPDIEELRYLFEQAGYDPGTLPGLDFEKAMAAFQAAFLAAAAKEPTLQGMIQTNHLIIQTGLQRELVAGMCQLVDLVGQAEPGSLVVKGREVLATIEGKQVVYVMVPHDAQPGDRDADHLRTAYLNRLFERVGRLSLAGIDPKAASDSQAQLNLDAVYTALFTMTPEDHGRLQEDRLPDREVKRLSALRMLNGQPRLVLLGGPGSGKTTFVNFVAMCLAGEAIGQSQVNLGLLTAPLPDDYGANQEEPQPWDHGPLLPVRVILRDFAARGLPPAGHRATADHLWRFIKSELDASAIGDYAAYLRNELLDHGGLILLDGLDEVPEADHRREQIKEAVEDFSATFHRCRVLVTSRTYAYQKQAWRLPDFAEAVLAPFTVGQIRRFVGRWYAHIGELRGLNPDDAQGGAELLKRAIFGSERLRAFAERPLLLTLMASLHAWRGGSLPEKREELYSDAVDLLLDWWESPKVVRDDQGKTVILQPSLAEWLKIDKGKVYDLLTGLAYQAHKVQPDLLGTADIPEADLVTGLMRLSQNPDVNPARLVEYLSQRAGLVLPREEGVYTPMAFVFTLFKNRFFNQQRNHLN
jgi:predicted ATPase